MTNINFQSIIERNFTFLNNKVEKEVFNSNQRNEAIVYYFDNFDLAFYQDYDKFQIQFIAKNKVAIDSIILLNYIESTKVFDYNISQITEKINNLWSRIPHYFTEKQVNKTIQETKKLKKLYQKKSGNLGI